MVHQDSNSSSTELTHIQNHVDSLKVEIQLRDSLIKDFETYIPIGSPLDSTKINSKYGWRWVIYLVHHKDHYHNHNIHYLV